MGILPCRFVLSDPPGGVFQPGRLPGRKCESRDFGVPSGVHEALVKRFVCEASGTCLKEKLFYNFRYKNQEDASLLDECELFRSFHDVFFDLITWLVPWQHYWGREKKLGNSSPPTWFWIRGTWHPKQLEKASIIFLKFSHIWGVNFPFILQRPRMEPPKNF